MTFQRWLASPLSHHWMTEAPPEEDDYELAARGLE